MRDERYPGVPGNVKFTVEHTRYQQRLQQRHRGLSPHFFTYFYHCFTKTKKGRERDRGKLLVGRDSPTPNLAKIHQFSITSHHHGGQQSGCKPSFPAVPDYHTCTRVFVGYHEQILQVVWSNYSIIVLHHEFSDSIRSGRHDSSIVNASHLQQKS